jgi:hypothetical protein
VESSSSLTFGPYNLTYPFLKSHSEAALIIGEYKDEEGQTFLKENKWKLIFDFTKDKEGKQNFELKDPSNFSIVQARSQVPHVAFEEYEGHVLHEDYLFDLPIEFGGSLVQSENKAKDSM